MTLALRLAAKGQGKTSPNPMVGAIVVSKGRIVGQAYHHAAGQPHAEVLALRQAGFLARGATLYVTLEPCSHLKKRTPPCVPAVIQSGVHRVVVAMRDPNPAVSGNGLAQLRRAGLAVTVGVARKDAEALNRAYCHWIVNERPYVTLKAGMTLDGQIATARGESQWITGLSSRQEVHRLRSAMDAVIVGIGTVQKDNPSLTARNAPGLTALAATQPTRIVVDSSLRIARSAKILTQQSRSKTIIATTKAASQARCRALERQGIEVLQLPSRGGHVSLKHLIAALGKRGMASVMVEGGGELNEAFFKAKLVHHVQLYVAPTLLGGAASKGVIGGAGPRRLADAWKLRQMRTRVLGTDVVVEGDV
ncbi:MAG: bifunctional diaminohydroxyphosphoribosylaminopyrimidine deaminase/5-amino-6-(5-phosphoribosylamino)uracil reductase RibD [Nitrospira sp.]|nr:bifunctional diaminohydroxyphosphoribosylaminopyrimidine deaminase/5-amino-6-(5-phosphoribosylamino)uracil reductase RibD [Nitrospira sp.]